MIYVDTLNETNDELLQLLSLFDYSGLVYFDKLNERTESAVREIIAQKNLCICKYYGRGYGILVAKAISKQIASIVHDVYAGILGQNTASRALFGKLGFKHIGQYQTITTQIRPMSNTWA